MDKQQSLSHENFKRGFKSLQTQKRTKKIRNQKDKAMKTYLITYNHNYYRPSSYDIYKKQLGFRLEIESDSIEGAKTILKKEHNLNPFYFNFIEK